MGNSKQKICKNIKNNFCNSLKEVNFFLCKLSKLNKGKKLYNILKK